MSSQAGYNTISQNGFAPNQVDAEGAALLSKPSNQQDAKAPLTSRLHEHFTANVSKSWADIALLGCYIITGLLDSSSVFIWGSFVSMQTGKEDEKSEIQQCYYTTPKRTKPYHEPDHKPRQYRLPRPRPRRPQRQRPLDALRHLNRLLLPRKPLLQLLPPHPLAPQALGPSLLAHPATPANNHRRLDGNPRPRDQQRNPFQPLHRGADRFDRVSSCWPGRDVAGVAVQWLDERGADFDLLRFVFGSGVGGWGEC